MYRFGIFDMIVLISTFWSQLSNNKNMVSREMQLFYNQFYKIFAKQFVVFYAKNKMYSLMKSERLLKKLKIFFHKVFNIYCFKLRSF